jgi:hypothetical protein
MQEAIRADIAFETGTMRAPAQGGVAATHPLPRRGIAGAPGAQAPVSLALVFASERDGPFIPLGFAKLFARAGDEPKIGFKGPPAHGIGIAPTLVVAAQQ